MGARRCSWLSHGGTTSPSGRAETASHPMSARALRALYLPAGDTPYGQGHTVARCAAGARGGFQDGYVDRYRDRPPSSIGHPKPERVFAERGPPVVHRLAAKDGDGSSTIISIELICLPQYAQSYTDRANLLRRNTLSASAWATCRELESDRKSSSSIRRMDNVPGRREGTPLRGSANEDWRRTAVLEP